MVKIKGRLDVTKSLSIGRHISYENQTFDSPGSNLSIDFYSGSYVLINLTSNLNITFTNPTENVEYSLTIVQNLLNKYSVNLPNNVLQPPEFNNLEIGQYISFKLFYDGGNYRVTGQNIETGTPNLDQVNVSNNATNDRHVVPLEQLNSRLNNLSAQPPVINILNDPPVSPTEGDRYIINENPTGIWVGQTDNIATYDGTTWMFITPNQGWFTWVLDDSDIYVFNNDTWNFIDSSITHNNLKSIQGGIDNERYHLTDSEHDRLINFDIDNIARTNINNDFSGTQTFNDIIVNGTRTIQNSQDLLVADNIIMVNVGETSAGVAERYAGLQIDRGTLADRAVLFDEQDDTLKHGIFNVIFGEVVSSTNNTITFSEEASIVNNIYNGQEMRVSKTNEVTQVRTIISYDGPSRTATVGTVWGINPDNTWSWRLIDQIDLYTIYSELNANKSTIDWNVKTLNTNSANSGDSYLNFDMLSSFVRNSNNVAYKTNNEFSILNSSDNKIFSVDPVTSTELYYNSIKRFETTDHGTLTTGTSELIDSTPYLQLTDSIASGQGKYWRLGQNTTNQLALEYSSDDNTYLTGILIKPSAETSLYYNNIEKLSTSNSGANVEGNLQVNNDNSKGLIIKSNTLSSLNGYQSSLEFIDSSNTSTSEIGFTSNTDNDLHLDNKIGETVISSNGTERVKTVPGGIDVPGDYYINGVSITDAGALVNVAYINQDNNFTTTQTIDGDLSLSGDINGTNLTTDNTILNHTTNSISLGNTSTNLNLISLGNIGVNIGSNNYNIYHTGNANLGSVNWQANLLTANNGIISNVNSGSIGLNIKGSLPSSGSLYRSILQFTDSLNIVTANIGFINNNNDLSVVNNRGDIVLSSSIIQDDSTTYALVVNQSNNSGNGIEINTNVNNSHTGLRWLQGTNEILKFSVSDSNELLGTFGGNIQVSQEVSAGSLRIANNAIDGAFLVSDADGNISFQTIDTSLTLQEVTTTGNSTTNQVFLTGGITSTVVNNTNERFGKSALSSLTVGLRNSAFGNNSLNLLIGGSDNTTFGNNSLSGVINNTGNTSIGSNSGNATNGATNSTFIGFNTSSSSSTTTRNSTALGFEADIDSDNQIVLGNEDINEIKTSGTFNSSNTSPLGSSPSGTNASTGQVLTADGSGNSNWISIPSVDLSAYNTTTELNTPGTLTNVAYKNLANQFSLAQTISGNISSAHLNLIKTTGTSNVGIRFTNPGNTRFLTLRDDNNLHLVSSITGSNKIWTEGNDGSGSGLDAGLLEGQNGAHYLNYNNFTNTPNLSVYLTAETDTLDSVTSRNNTTTNGINVGTTIIKTPILDNTLASLQVNGFQRTGSIILHSGTDNDNIGNTLNQNAQGILHRYRDGSLRWDTNILATQNWVTAQNYLTSFSETDTFATVLGRNNIAFNNTILGSLTDVNRYRYSTLRNIQSKQIQSTFSITGPTSTIYGAALETINSTDSITNIFIVGQDNKLYHNTNEIWDKGNFSGSLQAVTDIGSTSTNTITLSSNASNLVLSRPTQTSIQFNVGSLNRFIGVNNSGEFQISASADLNVNGDTIATQPWVQSQNYLTSFSETDTLATVLARGNSATNNINLNGNIILDGSTEYREIGVARRTGTVEKTYRTSYGIAGGSGHTFITNRNVTDDIQHVLTVRTDGNVDIDSAILATRNWVTGRNYLTIETDTFQSVSARGNSTNQIINISRTNWTGLNPFARLVVSDGDSVMQIASSNAGTYGSGITLSEHNPTTLGRVNQWDISRLTSSSNNLLTFRFGTGDQASNNSAVFTFQTNGQMNAAFVNLSSTPTLSTHAITRGYLESQNFLTSEIDTLQSVTNRGASSTNTITLSGNASNLVLSRPTQTSIQFNVGSLNRFIGVNNSGEFQISTSSDLSTGGVTIATQPWVTSQNYLTSFTEQDPTVPSHVKAITTGNISNWNTSYNSNIISATVTGNTTKTLTLNRRSGLPITTTWTDNDANTNNYVNSSSFNTSNGIITLGRLGLSPLTINMDGRYLTSFNETDTLESVLSRGNTANDTKIINLGNAEAETDAANLRDVKLAQLRERFENGAKLTTNSDGVAYYDVNDYGNLTCNIQLNFEISQSNIDLLFTDLDINTAKNFYLGYRPTGELIFIINDGVRRNLIVPQSEVNEALVDSFGLVTIIFSGDIATLYVNGKELGTIDGITTTQLDSEDTIKTRDTGTLRRRFSNVQIFNKSLTQDEVLDYALGNFDNAEKGVNPVDRWDVNKRYTKFDTNDGAVTSLTENTNNIVFGDVNTNMAVTTTGTSSSRPGLSLINFGGYYTLGTTIKMRMHYRVNSGLVNRLGILTDNVGIVTIANDLTGSGVLEYEFTYSRSSSTTNVLYFANQTLFDIDFGIEFIEIGQVVSYDSINLTPTVWRGLVNGEINEIPTGSLNVTETLKQEASRDWVLSRNYISTFSETDTLESVTTRGRDTSTNGSAVWDTNTQGTDTGNIHIRSIGDDNAGGAITWAASDFNQSTAQGGIYFNSDNSYGSRMYLATSDAYATGSQTAMWINDNGEINITRSNLKLDNGNIQLLDSSGTINFSAGKNINTTATPLINVVTQTGSNIPVLRRLSDSGGVALGGDDATIIGSGESTAVTAANINNITETLHLASDGTVNLYSNMQSGWASRRTITLNTDGTLRLAADPTNSMDAATMGWVEGLGYLTSESDTLQSVVSRGKSTNTFIDFRPSSVTEYAYRFIGQSTAQIPIRSMRNTTSSTIIWESIVGNELRYTNGSTQSTTVSSMIRLITGSNPRIAIGNTVLDSQTTGQLRVSAGNGYIDIGPQNASHAHIYTDRPNFYFNKELRFPKLTQHDGQDALTLLRRTSNGVGSNALYVNKGGTDGTIARFSYGATNTHTAGTTYLQVSTSGITTTQVNTSNRILANGTITGSEGSSARLQVNGFQRTGSVLIHSHAGDVVSGGIVSTSGQLTRFIDTTLRWNSEALATRNWVQSQNYLTSETDSQTLSWNGTNGQLTISGGNSVDLDGRYLQSFTETDTLSTVLSRGNSATNNINLNGNIAINGGSDYREVGVTRAISDGNEYKATLGVSSGGETFISARNNTDNDSRILRLQSNGSMTWNEEIMASQPWVQSQNYLTSYTETDTLATVVARGSSTNQSITIGGYILAAKTEASSTLIAMSNVPDGHTSFINFGAGNDSISFTKGLTGSASNKTIIYGSGFINTEQIATRPWVQSQNYLTSFSETDTLQSVTSRGNTTNQLITANSFRTNDTNVDYNHLFRNNAGNGTYTLYVGKTGGSEIAHFTHGSDIQGSGTSILRVGLGEVYGNNFRSNRVIAGEDFIPGQGASNAVLQVNGFQRTGSVLIHSHSADNVGGDLLSASGELTRFEDGGLRWSSQELYHTGNDNTLLSIRPMITTPFNSGVDNTDLTTRISDNSIRRLQYTGASSQLITFETGGSTSVFQIQANFSENYYMRNRTDSTNWKNWRRLWHNGDFTQTNVNQWSSAYNDVITSASVTGTTTKTITLTQRDGGVVQTSWSDINTNTDNYVDSVSFNNTNGRLTIGRTGSLIDLTTNLDGRYLTSFSETDTLQSVTGRGNTTNTSLTLFNGGGYTAYRSRRTISDVTYRTEMGTSNLGDGLFRVTNESTNESTDLLINPSSSSITIDGAELATQPWVTSQNYLTTETDTLQSVTSRGSVTTSLITVGGLRVNSGTIFLGANDYRLHRDSDNILKYRYDGTNDGAIWHTGNDDSLIKTIDTNFDGDIGTLDSAATDGWYKLDAGATGGPSGLMEGEIDVPNILFSYTGALGDFNYQQFHSLDTNDIYVRGRSSSPTDSEGWAKLINNNNIGDYTYTQAQSDNRFVRTVGQNTITDRFILDYSATGGDSTWNRSGMLIRNNHATPAECAVAFQSIATGSNYWMTGINQNSNYGLFYGTSMEDTVRMWYTTTAGNTVQQGTSTATNFILSSDVRVKENIKPLESKTKDIEFIDFNYKKDETKRSRKGVIAQELEKVAPEMVYEDEEGIKQVAYIDLLVDKVANLENENKAMKAENKAMKDEINEMKEMLKQLINK